MRQLNQSNQVKRPNGKVELKKWEGRVSDNRIEQVWLPIIARSLSRISLQGSAVAEGTSADKARFLESLGLPRKEVAEMLGTTAASITELLRRAKKRKKKK